MCCGSLPFEWRMEECFPWVHSGWYTVRRKGLMSWSFLFLRTIWEQGFVWARTIGGREISLFLSLHFFLSHSLTLFFFFFCLIFFLPPEHLSFGFITSTPNKRHLFKRNYLSPSFQKRNPYFLILFNKLLIKIFEWINWNCDTGSERST